MSLLQGNLTPLRLLALGPVPNDDELAAGLAKHLFRPFQDGSEEERYGWVDWRNPLIMPPDPSYLTQGGYAIFGLRVDTRKIQASIMKAHVDLRLKNLMQEKDLAFVSKEARISIQDEIKADLLKKVTPSMKSFEIAWDLKGGTVYTTASSNKAMGLVLELFMKSFGVELHPLVPLVLAGEVAPALSVDELQALDPMDLELEDVS